MASSKIKKSINKKNIKNAKIFILIIVLLILLVTLFNKDMLDQLIFVPKVENNNASNSQNHVTKYYSEQMGIAFYYPDNYELTDRSINILLESEVGQIIIGKVGTNYNSIDEFLDARFRLDNLKKNIISKHIDISGLDFVEVVLAYPNRPDLNRKEYFLYKNHSVLSLSTNKTDLYSDLDQIARSFRYTP
jgi:hypothetical protein